MAGRNPSGRRWRPPPFDKGGRIPPAADGGHRSPSGASRHLPRLGESVFDKGGLRANAGIGPCKLPQIFSPTNRKAHLWIPQAN